MFWECKESSDMNPDPLLSSAKWPSVLSMNEWLRLRFDVVFGHIDSHILPKFWPSHQQTRYESYQKCSSLILTILWREQYPFKSSSCSCLHHQHTVWKWWMVSTSDPSNSSSLQCSRQYTILTILPLQNREGDIIGAKFPVRSWLAEEWILVASPTFLSTGAHDPWLTTFSSW